jgi:hypothetical protein
MADLGGLLNIFGSVPSYASGLLSEEELDAAKGRARANALLQMGQSFYKAGAPRETPGGSALSGIAGALLSGQQAYQGAIKGSLEEKLNEQKIQDALNAKKRQTDIQGLISGAFQPAQAGQAAQPAPYLAGAPYGKATPEMPAMPARFDLQAIAPKLMSLGPEGYSALNDLMNAQKAMRPEMFSLAEGAKQFARDAQGNIVEIASGAPKTVEPKLAASFASAVDALGLPRKNASEYTDAERTAINKEMTKQRAESKQSLTIAMPSEGERKAATLASRMNFSVGQMMEAVGKDPSAAKPDTMAEAARFLSQSDWLPNKLNSTQRQIVEAAQEDILDAALTLGTGAAYTREQLAGYKKSYFPQLNDDADTVKSKQARLQNLLETAQLASGRAATQIPTPIPSPTDLSNISLDALIAERKRRQAKKD